MPSHPTPEQHELASSMHLGNIIRRLTDPAPSIREIEQRHRARLLASLLIAFIPLAFLAVIVQMLTVPGFERLFPTLFGSLVVLTLAYILSRTRHYKLGALITITIPTGAVFVNLLIDPTNTSTYFFVIISILLSSVLFAWRWTAVFVITTLIITITFLLFIPTMTLTNIATPLAFSIIVSGLILILVRYRDSLETSRQAKLTLSENRWRMTIDQSPFSTVIYSPNGRPEKFNQAAINLWNLSQQDLEIVRETYNILEDEQLEAKGVLPYIKRGFAGIATMTPPNQYEFQRTDDTTTSVADNRWIVAYCYPVKDEAGNVVEVVLIHEDITERKQAEATETRLWKMLDDSLSEIYTFDAVTLRFIQVNKGARENLGYSSTELEQMTPLDLKPELTPAFFAQLLKPLRTGEKEKIQFATVHRRRDGSLYPVEVHLQLSELGSEPVFVAIILDITERKQAEEMIRRQDRLSAVGQLAAGIAHDFNNVMAVITLYSQMLLKSPNFTEKERQRLQTIQQQANRAADLIGQVLDFSRQSVMERQPVELLPFLREFTKLLKRTLPEHIKINLDYGEDTYVVNADLTRIQQAVMNLAINARDAMPDGGELNVKLEQVNIPLDKPLPSPEMKTGEWVNIEVSDNGTGISSDVLQHVFEPFFTTKEPGLGTGLGLAQVYGIVKQHEGHIDVESRVGHGTTFTLRLPALSVIQSEVGPIEPKVLAKGKKETILVVEDDTATREALADSLELMNYQVLTAATGREALAVLEEHRDEVVLVLSDVVMPEMGGMELLQALKQMRIDVPVVMLTGHPLGEELEKLRAEGLREWLPKPVALGELAQAVAQLLRG